MVSYVSSLSPFRGLGLCSAGTSDFGYGNPATGKEINTFLFLESNNQYGNAPFIDPVTGDYVVASNGNLAGMSDVQQQVYLALFTALGSSADPNLGNQLSSVQMLGQNSLADITNYINVALSNLVFNNVISISNISVVQNDNPKTRLGITVLWVDLTTNQQFQTSF